MSVRSVESATTALFVPGDRPDRFRTAVASGADLVIVDLEDAVAPAQKSEARTATTRAILDRDSDFTPALRINSGGSERKADFDLLSRIADEGPGRIRAIVIPKAETHEDIAAVADVAPGVPLVPLIETAKGLAALDIVLRAPQVARLAFGALDFAVDVDATSIVLLNYARCEIVLRSRVAGRPQPLDSPNPDFRSESTVLRGAADARALGFGGQLCIHPAQVPLVARAFGPTAQERDWAERVVALSANGAVQLDGEMIDRPVVLRAEAILARAAR